MFLKEKGTFWGVFDCQEENEAMQICFDHELFSTIDPMF